MIKIMTKVICTNDKMIMIKGGYDYPNKLEKGKVYNALCTYSNTVWLEGFGSVLIERVKVLETDWVNELEERFFSDC